MLPIQPYTSFRSTERTESGFTLLEAVVVMALMAAAVAFIAPTLVGMTRRNNESAVQQQEKTITAAIFGDPVNGRFGFVGDVGRLPANLNELLSRGSLPAFHTADGGTPHIGNIGYGWNGPYLTGVFSNTDLVTDPWGQSFTYANTGATAGQVRSNGADGSTSTADDVTYPLYAPKTTGTVFISIIANGVANPFGTSAKVYYPSNGEQAVTATQKFDPNSPNESFDGFAFADVAPGVRIAVASHTDNGGSCGGGGCCTVTRTVPINVIAGRTNVVEIQLKTGAQVKVIGNYTCTIPD